MTLVPVGGDWFPLRGLWLLGSPRDRDVFIYCRLLSPCVLDRWLVFINPGLGQPASLTNVDLGTISTRNQVDNIFFSAYVEWGLSLSPKVA